MALSTQTKNYMKVAIASQDACDELTSAVDTVLVGQMNQNLLKYATTTLVKADINTLGSVPVTLVAAPGAGFVVLVDSIYTYYDYTTTAFTLTTETVDVKYAGSTTIVTGALANASLIGTADVGTYIKPAVTGLAAGAMDNKAIVLTTSGGTDPGAGHANSIIRCRVYYKIVPTTLA